MSLLKLLHSLKAFLKVLKILVKYYQFLIGLSFQLMSGKNQGRKDENIKLFTILFTI